jgi:hypothetical protein
MIQIVKNLSRPVRFAIGIFVLLAVVYAGLWYWELAAARSRIEALLGLPPDSPVTLSAAETSSGGFPFWVEVRLFNVALSGLPRLPEAHVAAPLIVFRFHPLTPGSWTLEAPKGFAVDLPSSGGTTHLTAKESTADSGKPVDEAHTANFRAGGIAIEGPGGAWGVGSVNLRMALPDQQTDEHRGEWLRFQVDVDGVALPHKVGVLGAEIERITANGGVQGIIPKQKLAAALASWRDLGGIVEFRAAHVAWGKLLLDGEGTMALDHEMQPEAAFSAEMRNWTMFLDALVDAGSMKQSEAEFAKLGLALMAGAGGDSSAINAPVTLQNGQIYIAKAKVARIPRVEWP